MLFEFSESDSEEERKQRFVSQPRRGTHISYILSVNHFFRTIESLVLVDYVQEALGRLCYCPFADVAEEFDAVKLLADDAYVMEVRIKHSVQTHKCFLIMY